VLALGGGPVVEGGRVGQAEALEEVALVERQRSFKRGRGQVGRGQLCRERQRIDADGGGKAERAVIDQRSSPSTRRRPWRVVRKVCGRRAGRGRARRRPAGGRA
jgi:hypothetical protein